MAKMPSRSSLILNPSSAAPGFKIKNVLCLPGVPSILKSMIENSKKYLIKGSTTFSKTVNLYTVESNISSEMKRIQNKFSKNIDIGSYPFFRLGKIGVSVVFKVYKQKKIKIMYDTN